MLLAVAEQPATSPGIEILYLSPLKALINDQFDRLERARRAGRDRRAPLAWRRARRQEDRGAAPARPGSFSSRPSRSKPSSSCAARRSRPCSARCATSSSTSCTPSSAPSAARSCSRCCTASSWPSAGGSPGIALSATLGDMDSAAEHLRPGSGGAVLHLVDDDDGQALKLQLRGYVRPSRDLADARRRRRPATTASPSPATSSRRCGARTI